MESCLRITPESLATRVGFGDECISYVSHDISADLPHSSLQPICVEIEQVHSYLQLGVILNDKLNLEDHAIYKANKKIGLMWKTE